MTDVFTSYETGLVQLLKRLSNNHPRYIDALVYQQRLQENVEQTRLYGDTETRRAERAQVVDALNRLALEAFGTSFNDLSQTQSVLPRQITPSSQHPPGWQLVRVKSRLLYIRSPLR